MDIQKVHPELRKAYSRMPALPVHNPVFRFILNLLMKLIPARIKPVAGVDIQDRAVGECTVRIFRPEARQAAPVCCGFTVGGTSWAMPG